MINFDYDLYKNNISISYKLDRAQGLYGDANNAALVGILGYIFIHQYFITKNIFQKILKVLLLAISVYALYLTYSTTGFVVFIMSFGLLNFKYFTRERLLILPVILIGAYFTLLNLSSLLEGIIDLNPRQQSKIDNFVNLLKLDFENVDDSGRDTFVAKLMEYIEQSPFIGNGLEFGSHHHGHNTYLYILSDAGILALIVFVILLFKYFESIFKIDMSSRLFALAILISFCMFMLSLQTIINQPYLMVVFVYLAYYIDNKIKNKQYDTE
ncbi:O-antigen ligase family protein [Hyunsoonleella sp. 2307UL5-6]|uniref:O-antigen ligase family protein n=1 Tax=Hyunsoonleella sp. 2307UL5-6 TaxID=3384768 RepID=UPI0039BC9BFF